MPLVGFGIGIRNWSFFRHYGLGISHSPLKTTFTSGAGLCTSERVMLKIKKWFSLFLAPALLAGCATSTLTNLTATQQPRNPTGQYLVEMKWDTTQQTLRTDTVTPHVVVGYDSYPMRPQLKMTNRWEALVPIPATTAVINYHFKVDYEYNKFGKAGQDSMRSSQYKLVVQEK